MVMEERDEIEQLIMAHRSNFDTAELPQGHLERFQRRLEQERRVKPLFQGRIWKVAAAVIFLFLAGNQARIWLVPEKETPTTLAALSPEYAEVEFYYTRAIQSGMEHLSYLTGSGVISAQDNAIMQEEFREFETRYKTLQEELQANPYDERVINAMIEYYQARLQVINMVLSKLEEVRQQNDGEGGRPQPL